MSGQQVCLAVEAVREFWRCLYVGNVKKRAVGLWLRAGLN